MERRYNPLFGSANKVPQTLADFKVWLLYKYPRTKFKLDISQENYRILRDNQIKMEQHCDADEE